MYKSEHRCTGVTGPGQEREQAHRHKHTPRSLEEAVTCGHG